MFFANDSSVNVPPWVINHESYRRWAMSDEFPDRGQISYLDGRLWVDLSMERAKHNQIKFACGYGVTKLIRRTRSGRYYADRMLLTNAKVGLSTEPDGTYFSFESLRTGRVVMKKGEEALEFEGSPDMALEVISASSIEKDAQILMQLYWRAGIREYWLVDPLGERVDFRIYEQNTKGYIQVPARDGWAKSELFGKSFHLSQTMAPDGMPEYSLKVR